MVDYETITLVSLGLAYLTSKVYLNQRRKKRLDDFNGWVMGDFSQRIKDLEETGDEFRINVNNLTNKLEGRIN